MERADIFSTLTEIFEDVMDVDDVTLEEATTADDVEEWDSLSNVRIIVAIEREYGIKFSNAEIGSFACVGDLVTSITEKAA